MYSSSVPHKSYVYGGQTGTTVCTVAFKKTPTSRANGTAVDGSDKEDVNPLFICIDVSCLEYPVAHQAYNQCGGTKTDVAISDKEGTVAQAIGGTGNMAEVCLLDFSDLN
jgi:hypothetical protein